MNNFQILWEKKPSLGQNQVYQNYYRSERFFNEVFSALKQDIVYGDAWNVWSIFDRALIWNSLNSEEFIALKRVFSDEYFLESLSKNISDNEIDDYITFIGELPLWSMNRFQYPFKENRGKNKVVFMAYIVWEFLSEMKNNYISNFISQTTTQVEWIIWEYAWEEIELIKQAKKYSLVKVWDVYKLYDNENKIFSTEYRVIKNDIIELQNWDISMVVTPKESNSKEVVISLETWEKHIYESEPFLSEEEFNHIIKWDFLSMDEVDELLRWVASEEDDWAAAMNRFSEQQQGQGDVLNDLATPLLDEIEGEFDECNGQANPEDIKK